VVTDNIAEPGFLAMGVHAQEVVKTLIALGGLGNIGLRNERVELAGQSACVHHLVLGITRMHAHTLDSHLGCRGVEVLILQVADIAAVHRIGPFATKLLHIEMVCALADLLIGIERHADIAVLDLVMVAQIAHRLHDFGNAGLVIGTEQCRSVGHNDVFSLVGQQLGKLRGR